MSVAATHFHEAVMPLRIGKTPDFIGSSDDQFGSAKFVDKSHDLFPIHEASSRSAPS
jgi:hypothetical protein